MSRRRLLAAVRAAWLVGLLGAAAVVLLRSRDDVGQLLDGSRPELLLLCLLASFGQVVLSAVVWASALQSFGHPVPLPRVLRATAASLPARYVPGSVWYAVSRGALLRADGVPVRSLTAVAVLETVLAPAVAVALGAALLSATGTVDLPAPALVAGAVALAAVPWVVGRALRIRTEDPPRLGAGALARLVGWLVVFWLWSGSVFALYAAALPGAVDADWATAVGAYLVAWAAGWVALLAPQGIGVVEVVLAGLLASGSAELAVVLGGYRLVILVRDVLAAVLASAGRPARRLPEGHDLPA